MKKRKKVIVLPTYIYFIKNKLPDWESEPLLEKNFNLNWFLPDRLDLKKDPPSPKKQESFEKNQPFKKLKFTQQEVKKSVQEDEASLKDVEKLEEHLEEDILKNKKKLKKIN